MRWWQLSLLVGISNPKLLWTQLSNTLHVPTQALINIMWKQGGGCAGVPQHIRPFARASRINGHGQWSRNVSGGSSRRSFNLCRGANGAGDALPLWYSVCHWISCASWLGCIKESWVNFEWLQMYPTTSWERVNQWLQVVLALACKVPDDFKEKSKHENHAMWYRWYGLTLWSQGRSGCNCKWKFSNSLCARDLFTASLSHAFAEPLDICIHNESICFNQK